MKRRVLQSVLGVVMVIAAMAAMTAHVKGQQGPTRSDWRYWGGDAGSTKYSPLEQINKENVTTLRIAWRWKAENFGARPDFNWEVTPLMVNGVLYFTAGTRRDAIAADAATGETLWMYRLDEGERGRVAVRHQNRGLAYWTDGKGDERIVLISPGFQLIALDAKTGRPIPSFGQSGIVDLFEGLDRDVKPGTIGSSSPAIVIRDVVVIGPALLSGSVPRSKQNVPGYIRGYDVRTGKRIWTFHTVAQPGEFGAETWENGSSKYTGNTGAWAPLSGDEELGYVYVPVEMATGDYYGGHRHGDNLFAESLVCLDARTGKRVWHFQMIHHGIWDWDNPTAPVLMDITVNGRKIKAVAQTTKQAFTYVFDRVTGEPVWPIEERPVPQSDVPGEKTSPTQPFPTKPPAFDRQGVTLDDFIDLTPELKAEAVKMASDYKLGPIFTPPIVAGANGLKGVLSLPSPGGGGNWTGGAFDPETGMLFVPSGTNLAPQALVHDAKRSDMDYVSGSMGEAFGSIGPAGPRMFGPQGLPMVKPPWGRVTALDMNTGDLKWTMVNGDAPEWIQKHPALKGITLPKTGRFAMFGLLATKTLLFVGEGSGMFAATPGAGGPMLRAVDKFTGEILCEFKLPANQAGNPMTYMANGKQYIVVAVGAPGVPAELVALTVP